MLQHLLSAGIQDFRDLRESNCYCAGKTGCALRLVAKGASYLLSRPRGFGESLLVDTLNELLEGSRELFQGLRSYDCWDWLVRYRLVLLSFGGGKFHERSALHAFATGQLGRIERTTQSERCSVAASGRLRDLLAALQERTRKSVVLPVDEYDKPVLDALEDQSVARANRDHLHSCCSVIESGDSHSSLLLATPGRATPQCATWSRAVPDVRRVSDAAGIRPGPWRR